MLHSAHLQLQALFGVEPRHSRDAAGVFHHSFGGRMLRAMCCAIARVALYEATRALIVKQDDPNRDDYAVAFKRVRATALARVRPATGLLARS